MPSRKPDVTGAGAYPSPSDAFVKALQSIAAREQLTVKEAPVELNQAHSRSHQLAGELGLPPRPMQQQPALQMRSIFVDHYAVLIASLGESASLAQVYQRITYYHRHAAVCLSWLPANFKSDLNLFLVGPAGSGAKDEWCGVAARIERDESVCRKMVWLPPADSKEVDRSATAFFERTFLARPWKLLGNLQTPDLSPLNRLSLGDPVLMSWLAVLDKSDNDPGVSLVDRLILEWTNIHGKGGNVS